MSDLHDNPARAIEREPQPSARSGPERAPAPTAGPRLVRKKRNHDPFYINPRMIPPGVSYQWVMQSVFGQHYDEHWIGMRENHWRPVPAERHKELAIAGESVIRRGGTILCERPKYLTEEAELEILGEAMKPVQGMEEIMYGSKHGEFTRDHPSVRKIAGVRQQWAPGAPIDEGTLSSEP